MTDRVLAMRGVVVNRAGAPVVRGVEIDVAPGEVVAVLGANGAGKTTLFEALTGLLPLTAGSVEVLGRPHPGLRPQQLARRGMVFVPEGRALFPRLTVRENVLVRTRRRRTAEQALCRFPLLTPLAHRKAGALSGGEQQLLALACALAMHPRLLLVDELTMGLAPTAVTELLNTVRQVAGQGVSVLFVDQHVHAALDVADRAYVLRRGEVVLSGSAAEVAARGDDLNASYLTGKSDGAADPGVAPIR